MGSHVSQMGDRLSQITKLVALAAGLGLLFRSQHKRQHPEVQDKKKQTLDKSLIIVKCKIFPFKKKNSVWML